MFCFRLPSCALASVDDDGGSDHGGGAGGSGFRLRHAHMRAPDGSTMPADVSVVETEEGAGVKCLTDQSGSAALALEWDCGAHGRLLLQTCLLPPREKPYSLTLELARRHVMLYLVKLEEWGEFSRPVDDPVAARAIEARRLFMDALAMRSEDDAARAEQDELAQRALEMAIGAGESLTSEHADAELGRRQRTAPLASAGAVTGCSVDPERFSEPLRKVISGAFDFMTVPLRWKELEPEEGKYSFAETDRWIEWGVRQAKLPVAAGPVVEFTGDSTPEWFFVWENDYETIREMVYEHVKRVVTRYRRAVYKWTIASGLHVGSTLPLSLEETVDLTRLASLVARKLDPKAMIVVEIDRPLGEPAAGRPQAVSPELYAELIAQSGIACDAFGLRFQVGDELNGRPTFDLMNLSDAIDRYAVFEKPLCLSAIGAPSGGNGPPWGEGWDPARQAEWMRRVVEVALSKPFVTSVAWSQLYDTERTGQPQTGGLITHAGKPKEALACAAEIRKKLRAGDRIPSCPATA